MTFVAIERTDLDQSLQEKLAHFELNRHAYLDVQQRFSEIVQEDQRLRNQASMLDTQVNATDRAWRQLASEPNASQTEINAEIERGKKLQQEAEVLRLTAGARSNTQSKLMINLAEARIKLVHVPGEINKAYWQALLAKALTQEGIRESLLELFALSRALFLKSIDEHDGALSRCNGQHERQTKIQELTWRAFGQEVGKLFNGAELVIQPPTLAVMPSTVHSEALVETPGDLMRLRQARKA